MTAIMTVDDTIEVRMILKKILAKEGYDVIGAENGLDALTILRDTTPDLILLDIMMPMMDGWETLEKIRNNPQTKNIPVLMLTAKGQSDDQTRSFDLKADGHLNKPIMKDKLLSGVNFVLRNSIRRVTT